MKLANNLFKHLSFGLLMGSLLVACGKDNKSGQSSLSQWGINGLGVGQYGQIGTISNSVVAAAVSQNVCLGGSNNIYGYNSSQYNTGRYAVQFPLNMTPFTAGDFYMGVTSYGDVAVVVGQGASAQPLFIAYVCPRSGMSGGQGRLLANPQLLSYSPHCGSSSKPMNATMVLPSAFGQDGLAFRWADGGNSQRMPFSFCTGMIR